MRLVVDANVRVAGLGFGGFCYQVLDRCLHEHTTVISEHILNETRRHLIGKIGLPFGLAEARLQLLMKDCLLVQPVAVLSNACRDPDDLPVLSTAVAGHAERLVTGDRDLLDLGTYGGCLIQAPRDFWQSLP